MSLVDMQPSESSRSNVAAAAARNDSSHVVGVDGRVGREDDEHRRERWREHAGALGHAADHPPVAVGHRLLGWVSVVRIASAAASPPPADRDSYASSMPARRAVSSSVSPMRPVEQTATSIAPDVEQGAGELGGAVRGQEAIGSGVAVRAAGVEDDSAQLPVLHDLATPDDRVGHAPVGGEHARGREGRTVVHDERDVRTPAGLEARGDAGGAEAGSSGHAHGATPWTGSPTVSGRPRARLAF